MREPPEPRLPEDEVDLVQLLHTVRRGLWIVILCVLLSVAAGYYYMIRIAVPHYSATAVVALVDRENAVIEMKNVVGQLDTSASTINTEVEVLRSRRLIGQLVDDLSLTQDPEFNVRLRPPEKWSLSALKRVILPDQEPAAEPTAEAIRASAVDAVLGKLDINNMSDSYVFSIQVETTSPEKSAAIANALAELYTREQLELKFEATERATEWLGEQVVSFKSELENAQKELSDFMASTELRAQLGTGGGSRNGAASDLLSGLGLQLKDLRERLLGTQAAAEGVGARLATLESAVRNNAPSEAAAAADDATLNRLLEALSEGAVTRASFDQRVEVVVQQLRREEARERRQAEVLQSSIAELEQRIARQSDELMQLQQLEREVEATALIYESFLSRLKETSVQQGLQQADARILSEAVVRSRPSRPRKGVVLSLAILLGAVAGVGLALRAEWRPNVFRTAEELEQATRLPILGQVPLAPTPHRQRLLEHVVQKPNSAFSEAVRNLRTSVLLSDVDHPPRVILLTSSLPGEGKTTLALSLAHNLSLIGGRVLLVEADFRRRSFSEYFESSDEEPGLVAAVTGKFPLAELVAHSSEMGIDILLSEKTQLNAADFFSSKSVASFVERARDTYDYVLIDTPPVLLVPDARILGQLADAILYVVQWDATTKADVLNGLRAFESVDLRASGMILNKLDPKGLKRYGLKGYGTYSSDYYQT